MLLAGIIALVSPIRIALVGTGSDALGSELSQLLGAGYEVRTFSSVEEISQFGPKYLVLEPLPSSARSATYDKFVPEIKSAVSTFTNLAGHPKVFLCLDAPQTEEEKVFVRPLTIQAAREAGAQTVDSVSDASMAQQLFGYFFDWKAEKAGWSVVSADSEQSDDGPAKGAIDGDPLTYWHTQYSPKTTKYPHEIVIDMGSVRTIGGFRYMPRQDGGTNGRVKLYEYSVSLDGKNWGHPVAMGSFANTMSPSVVPLGAAVKARFFKFRALSEQHGQPYASAGELDTLPEHFAHS